MFSNCMLISESFIVFVVENGMVSIVFVMDNQITVINFMDGRKNLCTSWDGVMDSGGYNLMMNSFMMGDNWVSSNMSMRVMIVFESVIGSMVERICSRNKIQ